MSEFLMVVPPDFIEAVDADALIRASDATAVASYIANGEWTPVSQLLEDGGYIAPNTLVSDARMFDTGGVFRFWYKL